MNISTRFRPSLALLTDLYQLTMAQGYWRKGMAEQEAVFHLFFRKNPFNGGYTVMAGLADAIDLLQNLQFTPEDTAYLGSLRGSKNQPLFEPEFLEYLQQIRFTCEVSAVPEGTVVFPSEPLLRISGPILQCQLVETPLLTVINFQTLVATKAARIVEAAQGDRVIEFGMRRAQGPDGSLSATRAAFIGGIGATSNLLAGQMFNIPVKGTHAHSWVMSFAEEKDAFAAYADVFPDDSVFLVDTYNTIAGIKKAVAVAKDLRARGHELQGVRLDSGDLAYLSKEGRRLFDEAGFPAVSIVASNDLDEYLIESLKRQGARIDTWGIGTKLVTAYDQPALGGVYKLGALRNPETGEWEYKLKLSEQLAKISNPGIQQVRRFYNERGFMADMIYSEETTPTSTLVDPNDITRRKTMNSETTYQDLLITVFQQGQLIYQTPDLVTIQQYARKQVQQLHETTRRFLNPHVYPVGLEENLFNQKLEIILKLRQGEKV
ncbi:MAG: nicotinate phosphoribosyltransferase [Bacteroidota bacterium]|nr:nicotinate phosphoribosyltransferase [Bacteroidota bacterium]